MMRLLKKGFLLTTITLLGVSLVGWVSADYWWHTQIKPLPEYQLVAVAEAFQQCDMAKFEQAIDLNHVLYGMGEQQVQAELKKRTALTRNLVNSRLVAPFIRQKIQSTIQTIEQDITSCSAKPHHTNPLPFWVVPSLQSLVVFKSLFTVVTIEESKVAEDGQTATLLLRSAISSPRVFEATIELKKQQNASSPWQITYVALNDNLAALMNKINPKPKKKNHAHDKVN
jgi:hypothetical protein